MDKPMILNIISTLSFIVWCFVFIVAPIYIILDKFTTKFSKAKHYRKPDEPHTPGTGYQPRYDNLGDPPCTGSNIGRRNAK